MSVFSLGKTIKLLEKAQDQGVNVSFTDNEVSVHVEKGKVIDPVLLQELKSNKPSLIYYFTNHVTNGQKSHLSQSIQKFDRTEIQKYPRILCTGTFMVHSPVGRQRTLPHTVGYEAERQR